MSRRDKMRKAFSNVLGQHEIQKDVKNVDPNTQKICGTCNNFSENAYSSDGRGTCKVLKMGSDIKTSPPEFVLEGKGGFNTRTLSIAEECSYYDKMNYIDKDGYECSDPQYRRSMRQLNNK